MSPTVFLALVVGDGQSLLNVQFVTQWHQMDMDRPNQHLHISVLPERVLLLQGQMSRSLICTRLHTFPIQLKSKFISFS